MAMKLKKKAAVEAPVAKKKTEVVAAAPLDPEVDEIVALIEWDKSVKADPRAKRLKELKAAFVEKSKSTNDPTVEVVFRGVKTDYVLGAAAEERYVKDLKGLAKFMGDSFWEVATITMKAIDDYVPKLKQKEFVETRPGARSGSTRQR